MLMDIEAGSIEKKEKQPKPKKTYGQKRLIAAEVAMYCLVSLAVSVIPGLIASGNYNNDIREFDTKQNKIYEQFMASDEFSDSFKAEFTKISNDYANGLIGYEEFDKQVKHLNSVEYAQHVVANSTNAEIKAQIDEIEQDKEERTKKYNSSIAPNISLGGMIVSVTTMFGAIVANTVYGIKEDNEEKRKRKSNVHGIKYYDATTMTIRNTNGMVEEDEQSLNK